MSSYYFFINYFFIKKIWVANIILLIIFLLKKISVATIILLILFLLGDKFFHEINFREALYTATGIAKDPSTIIFSNTHTHLVLYTETIS